MAHPADIIAEAFLEAARQTGPEIQADVQTLISVPVEYIDGHIIRSLPGENPRLETGRLHDSIAQHAQRDGDRLTLAVVTGVEYAPRLQLQMERPIFNGVDEEWLRVLVSRVVGAIGHQQR